MSSKMKLSILTPEKTFYTGEVSEVNTKTISGGIGILPQHSPFVGLLAPAGTRFKLEDGSEKTAFTSTGIIKVTKTEVAMIVDAAEWPEEIDIRRAEEAKDRAEERLKNKDKIDAKRAELALARAIARIRLK
ncbi:F0F1 ATP synthase subunit epsilon [Clostridium sp. DJ247]|uniref:F0F1 ATP synthase subunit epsilon n=1 Tax=Clostridium sp. DJ247 TaxID=2726188 RepID=UPI001628B7D4|nr:F0F1 ATP synthase subunit epsilon [Clostridium sp. DJ247]MBC2579845.1 F0F1 ATP synthase subunit epsilon [Clostridium sp. DJ247]